MGTIIRPSVLGSLECCPPGLSHAAPPLKSIDVQEAGCSQTSTKPIPASDAHQKPSSPYERWRSDRHTQMLLPPHPAPAVTTYGSTNLRQKKAHGPLKTPPSTWAGALPAGELGIVCEDLAGLIEVYEHHGAVVIDQASHRASRWVLA